MGIRYAYENSADGSYTWRNQLVQERMRQQHDWNYLLKWFRASGVAGIIAPSLGRPRSGISLIAEEQTNGIPARLFRIDDSLPPVRRVTNIVQASSAEEALSRFDEPQFDERTMIVVEGSQDPTHGRSGDARIVADSADRLLIHTEGPGTAYLFVARTYTTATRAFVNGARARILPANVHCMAVPVPAGASQITIVR